MANLQLALLLLSLALVGADVRSRLLTSCPAVPSGFVFVPHYDPWGYDIANYGANVDNAAQTCLASHECLGFNSNGWAKRTLDPQSQWSWWTSDPCLGFYKRVLQPSSSCPPNRAPGYVFHPFVDSWGGDYAKLSDADQVSDAASQCSPNSNCKGFNTNGWGKSSLATPDLWKIWTPDACKGLLVKSDETESTSSSSTKTSTATSSSSTTSSGATTTTSATSAVPTTSSSSTTMTSSSTSGSSTSKSTLTTAVMATSSTTTSTVTSTTTTSITTTTTSSLRSTLQTTSSRSTASTASSSTTTSTAAPCSHPAGFNFVPFKDSPGNDLGDWGDDVACVAQMCLESPDCAAFNSNGWAKSALADESEWDTWTSEQCKGLYIKDPDAPSPSPETVVSVGEVIIRVDTVMWHSPMTAEEYIDSFVAHCVSVGVTGVSILMKRADVDVGLGHLMYQSGLSNTQVWEGDDYDEKYLFYLLRELRQRGIKTYAWLPIFNDFVLAQSDPTLLQHSRPVDGNGIFTSNSISPSLKFVSPHSSKVRHHELNLLEEILLHPEMQGWDGVRLDYIRYQEAQFDFSIPAQQDFAEKYPGLDLMSVQSTSDATYMAWRRDTITDFLAIAAARARGVVSNPDLDVGGYLLPFSAHQCGYNCFSNWGNDFTKYSPFMRVMPMVYWQDWTSKDQFQDWVSEKVGYSVQQTDDSPVVWPTYSITTTGWCGNDECCHVDYLSQALLVAAAGGAGTGYSARPVSMFFYFAWGPTEWSRLKRALSRANAAIAAAR